MKTADIDALILRQIFVTRFAEGFAQELAGVFREPDRELIAFMRDWIDDASQTDLMALVRLDRRNKRVRKLIDRFKVMDTKTGRVLATHSAKKLTDFIRSEAAAMAKIMKNPGVGKIGMSALLDEPVMGASITQEVKSQSTYWWLTVQKATRDAIQSNNDPIAALRGTKANRYNDGAIAIRNRRVKRSARTLVFGARNNTHARAYEKAKLEKVDYIATLDHRTCLQCAANEENSPYIAGTEPRPPVHPECRCFVAPSGADAERPYVEDDRSIKDIPEDERAAITGQGKFGYQVFFERQTEANKRKILGKARYQLYKDKKLKITDFYDDTSQAIYTVEQLDRMF